LTVQSVRNSDVVDAERVHQVLQSHRIGGHLREPFTRNRDLDDAGSGGQPFRLTDVKPCYGTRLFNRLYFERLTWILENLHLLADELLQVKFLDRTDPGFVNRDGDEVDDAKQREERLRRRAHGRNAEQCDRGTHTCNRRGDSSDRPCASPRRHRLLLLQPRAQRGRKHWSGILTKGVKF
jgi:hypothetical protein